MADAQSSLGARSRYRRLGSADGLDIKPVGRDARGEPTDKIFAALPGVVRYISTKPGESNYGRYIVIEHPGVTPAVFTLYAHLAKIEPGVGVGSNVQLGQVIATMGRSAGGGGIPVERAHLHFEIGLMATTGFSSWYTWKKFGRTNEHGLWNGMNLMGLDPLDFLRQWRERRVDNLQQYFANMRSVVRVRVVTTRTPDFIRRYPALLRKPLPLGFVSGWEIECNATGLPFAWTPLTTTEVVALPYEQPRLTHVNAELEKRQRSRSLAVNRRGNLIVGKDLETVLQQLFGLK